MTSIKVNLAIGLTLASVYLIVGVLGNTKYMKILPSDAKSFVVKPRTRIPIPGEFAKKYWISGTFFNKQNFQGLPMSFYLSGSKCINFPIHKPLSSLKPLGSCVMLYQSKDCTGPYAVVADEMANLNEVGMAKNLGSMKACPSVDDSWRQKKKEESNKKGDKSDTEVDTTTTTSSSTNV